ncbi:hypothetical protein, conserved, partial [Eimeria praecox]
MDVNAMVTHDLKWEDAHSELASSLSHEAFNSPDAISHAETTRSDGFRPSLGTGLRQRRGDHKVSTHFWVLASTVTFVMIFAWLALCIAPRNGGKTARLVQRHLSDNWGEGELSTILEGCLELQEELGLQPVAPEHDEGPEVKKARLLLMLHGSAKAFERGREGSSSARQQEARELPDRHPEHEQSLPVEQFALNVPQHEVTFGSEGTTGLPDAPPNEESTRKRTAKIYPRSSYPLIFSLLEAPLPGKPAITKSGRRKKRASKTPYSGIEGGPGPTLRLDITRISKRRRGAKRASFTIETSASPAGASVSASDSKGTPESLEKGLSPDDWILGGHKGNPVQEVQGVEGEKSSKRTAKRPRLAGSAADTSTSRDPVLPGVSISNDQDAGEAASGSSYTGVWQGAAEKPAQQELVQAEKLVEGEAQEEMLPGVSISNDQDAGEAASGSSYTGAWQDAAEKAAQQELVQAEKLLEGEAQEEETLAGDASSSGLLSLKALLTRNNTAMRLHEAAWALRHPFVRLPKMEPTNIKITFEGANAFFGSFEKGTPMKNFVSMRSIFAKPSVTLRDAMQLMDDCSCLVAYVYQKLRHPYAKKNPFYVTRKLASLLMVLDYLVSTIEVLGDKMDAQSWWPQLTENIQIDYVFIKKLRTQRVTGELGALAVRLSGALATYKTGARPPPQEIIE